MVLFLLLNLVRESKFFKGYKMKYLLLSSLLILSGFQMGCAQEDQQGNVTQSSASLPEIVVTVDCVQANNTVKSNVTNNANTKVTSDFKAGSIIKFTLTVPDAESYDCGYYERNSAELHDCNVFKNASPEIQSDPADMIQSYFFIHFKHRTTGAVISRSIILNPVK